MGERIDLLNSGANFLSKAGIENYSGESEIFLAHVLNCRRVQLYLDNQLVQKQRKRDFWHLLTERAKREPLQYLTKSTQFFGLELKMDYNVFIPRPETEILVETALNLLTNQRTNEPINKPTILDIGTGSGNIAICLAKFLEKADIFACDICETALKLAQENARLNKVNILLLKGDLFSSFSIKDYFSLIVSNPPYISRPQIAKLPREVQKEPRLAVDGGPDGLSSLRRIIERAHYYLKRSGFLVLEIGDQQSFAVQEIIERSNRLKLYNVMKDNNSIDRVIVAEKV